MDNSDRIEIKRLADESRGDCLIKHISTGDGWSELKELPVHRDDSFLFVLLVRGSGEMEIDFHRVEMAGPHLCMVFPGQVHHKIAGCDAEAWVVRVGGSYVSADLQGHLNSALYRRQHFRLDAVQLEEAVSVLRLAARHFESDRDRPLWNRVASSVLSLFLWQAASVAVSDGDDSRRVRPRQIGLCDSFKRLLSEYSPDMRTPGRCASRLCVSEAYLNEVVKKNTGFPVSYWIKEALMLEAKRLLCFTEKSIKEIAYATGYDDPVYFTKIFRKHAGMPPAAFRARYRE